MAKSGFWLRGAKGQLAGTVLYQSQGSTIQREIVTPKNPQSDNQMRQRAAFAGASKFYQNAQQNRFVLAFQNKKGNQSEFNAFMQKNLKEFDTLTYPTREQANTPEFCNYFPWICTEGNLQGIGVSIRNSEMGSNIMIYSETASKTAENWDELIAMNPALNLQYGDIITLTVVVNDEKFNDTTLNVELGNITPRWITRQFIVGADLGGYTLEEYITMNGLYLGLDDDEGNEYIGINMTPLCKELGIISQGDVFVEDNVAAMMCITRSRNEGSQLKVSSSRFYLDEMAQRIFERLSNDSAMRDAIESYKKGSNSNIEPANILQGSVAENIPVSDLYYRNTSGDTIHASAPATGVSAEAVVIEDNATSEFTILGKASGEDVNPANVSASADGWTVAIVSTKQRVQGPHNMSLKEGAKITFSKRFEQSGQTGSTPFSIKYNGIEVAGGNIHFSS